MIRVYTAPGSRSGRMVVQWLKENNLSFIEKNIFSLPMCRSFHISKDIHSYQYNFFYQLFDRLE